MNIHLTLNFDNNEWIHEIDGDGPWLDVFIGFTSNGDETVFDDLSFAWTLTVGDQPRGSKTYPPEGTIYLSTDQPYIVAERIEDVQADDHCVFVLTARNAGIDYEDVESFTIPRPPQPSPDCEWDDEDKSWRCPDEPSAADDDQS